ncbi:hypothetical protein [Streptomyces sindenensis]|uniref:Uncharacterized protein n=1 Tax=Streptomyces sindenensis TaxID=67363 RepID=A0ABW6EAD8_9ACTN
MARGGDKRRSQESALGLGEAVSRAQRGDESAFEEAYQLPWLSEDRLFHRRAARPGAGEGWPGPVPDP